MSADSFTIREYFRTAVTLVRQHTIVVWYLLILGIINTIIAIQNTSGQPNILGILVFSLSLCTTPVIYGIYYELIEDNYSSITRITRVYVPRYLWLLLRMYLPAVFVAWLPMMIAPESAAGGGFFHVIIVSFSLIYLYVLPFYYFTGQQQGVITLGIQFLVRNLVSSTPLILTVLLLETIMLLVQYNKAAVLESSLYLFAILDFSTFFIASIIDFILFIILIFILKNNFGTDASG